MPGKTGLKLRKLIQELLSSPPPDAKIYNPQGKSSITFILPYSKIVETRCRNYLSENAQTIFKKKIRSHYKVLLIDYLEDALKKHL